MCRLLESGKNVVSSVGGAAAAPGDRRSRDGRQLEAACAEGGTSCFTSGIDPGFANDLLPVDAQRLLRSASTRSAVRRSSTTTRTTRPTVLFDTMGFGQAHRQHAVPADARRARVRVGRGRPPDRRGSRRRGRRDPRALRARARARDVRDRGRHRRGGHRRRDCASRSRASSVASPRIVVEHVTRLRDDLAPEWPAPSDGGCYRIEVEGSPRFTCELSMLGEDGDHNTGGLLATAMRMLNAIPAVVAAPPGMLACSTCPSAPAAASSGKRPGRRPGAGTVRRRGRAASPAPPSAASVSGASTTPPPSTRSSTRPRSATSGSSSTAPVVPPHRLRPGRRRAVPPRLPGHRLLRAAAGAEVCVTVTLRRRPGAGPLGLPPLDQLPLRGGARPRPQVTDADEKRAAMDALVEHVVAGRSARVPAGQRARSCAATTVLALLDEASAKVRTGRPERRARGPRPPPLGRRAPAGRRARVAPARSGAPRRPPGAAERPGVAAALAPRSGSRAARWRSLSGLITEWDRRGSPCRPSRWRAPAPAPRRSAAGGRDRR